MKRLLLSFHVTTAARLKKASIPIGTSLTKWINDSICEKLDRDQPDTILADGERAAVVASAKLAKRAAFESRVGGVHRPDFGDGKPKIDAHAILADMKARERKDFGPYCIYYADTTMYRLALKQHNKAGAETVGIEGYLEKMIGDDPALVLSHERKVQIMADYKAKLASQPAVPDHLLGHPQRIKKWREAGSPMADIPTFGPVTSPYAQDTQEFREIMQTAKSETPAVEDEDPDFWGEKFLAIKAKAGK